MQRLYANQSFSIGQLIEIDETEAHHAIKVIRLKTGDVAELFNGKGSVATAELKEIKKRSCSFEITAVNSIPIAHRITVAFAVPKGQALDFILHRCCELGTKTFQPLLTEHSLHPSSWNNERWLKVLIEVCKQCQSPYLPELKEPVKLAAWLKERPKDSLLLFCDEEKRGEKPPFVASGQDADVLIGAEGGWSEAERLEILKAGAHPLSLGSNRLRAETASLVALTRAKLLVGEL